MATIASTATGNWSAGGTWAGGVAPVAGDVAQIALGHVITVDDLSRACLRVELTGTLTASLAGVKLTFDDAANAGVKFMASTGTLTDSITPNSGAHQWILTSAGGEAPTNKWSWSQDTASLSPVVTTKDLQCIGCKYGIMPMNDG